MKKHLLLFTFGLLLTLSLIDIVLANPIPWGSPEGQETIGYLSIMAAELCGLFTGVAILNNNGQARWQKNVLAMSAALVISYALGIAIWTAGRMSGLLTYAPTSPFFSSTSSPLGMVIILLPEFIGTVAGTLVIRVNLRTRWKTALISMASAMMVSFAVGMAITIVYYLEATGAFVFLPF